MKDALGNEIVIGNVYGYSCRSNGIATVIVGTAIKICARNVTLRVTGRGRALYSGDVKKDPIEKPTASVVSNSLFPISDKDAFVVSSGCAWEEENDWDL